MLNAKQEELLNNYVVGDIVKGVVNGLEPYGAFLTIDTKGTRGLIHISNVSSEIVDVIDRHFKIGDTVEARVIELKLDGNLGLSTKGVQLPNYCSIKQRNEMVGNEEYDQIYKIMQASTGVVSPKSKEKIKWLIDEHGIFKFMLTLAMVNKDFDVDLGLLFTNEIEKNLSECL